MMRGLPVPEWTSPQNALLVEMIDRERREKEASLHFLMTLIATPVFQDAQVSWEDKQAYIAGATERLRSVLWETRYTQDYLKDQLQARYDKLKADTDILDAVGGMSR